jgi:hypothetical protein
MRAQIVENYEGHVSIVVYFDGYKAWANYADEKDSDTTGSSLH